MPVSANVESLGTQENEEVNYDWKYYYYVIGYLPWLSIILAIGILKDNHKSETWYILIPLLILNFFWMLFKQLSGTNSSNEVEFDVIFYSTLIGLSFLWLISHKLSKLSGSMRFVLSLIFMILILSAGIFSSLSPFSKTAGQVSLFAVFIIIALLAGLACAGKLCKRKYNPIAFTLWLVICMPVLSIISMFLFFVIGSAVTNSDVRAQVLIEVAVVGFIIGLLLFVINLPFLILGFAIPFYRERLCGCLGLKGVDEIDSIMAKLAK